MRRCRIIPEKTVAVMPHLFCAYYSVKPLCQRRCSHLPGNVGRNSSAPTDDRGIPRCTQTDLTELPSRGGSPSARTLRFEAVEGIYRTCVLPATAFTTHDAIEAVFGQPPLIVTTGTLNAKIQVMQRADFQPAANRIHVRSRPRQLALQPLIPCPPHHWSRAQILCHCQIQQKLLQFARRHVTNTNPIGSGDTECSLRA